MTDALNGHRGFFWEFLLSSLLARDSDTLLQARSTWLFPAFLSTTRFGCLGFGWR